MTFYNSYSIEFMSRAGGGPPPWTLAVFRGDDGCTGTTSVGRDTSDIDPPGSTRVSFTAAGIGSFYRAKLVNVSGASVPLTYRLSDTTQFSPAWSTNGSFDTFYSFQNTTNATVSGSLTFFLTTGGLEGTIPISIPPGQTVSTNTAALSRSRDRTGTVSFTHDGPPGAIVAAAAIANFTISPAYVQPVKFQAVRESR